jgi:NADH-ubiquinone oxidoreductase chain 5
MCGDFNFVFSHSMVGTAYNIVFGMTGLLVISIFGGSFLMWLICPTPSIICLPYYLRFFTVLVVVVGGWLGYGLAGSDFGDGLFSISYYGSSSFLNP